MSSQSWLPIPRSSPFSLANLPFGIVSTEASPAPRPAVAIGDYALDLLVFSSSNGFTPVKSLLHDIAVFSEPTLNAFAALGRPIHKEVRNYLQDVFRSNTPFPDILKDNRYLQQQCLLRLEEVKMHLPMQIGDYTDFFVGRNHAFNAGLLFRGPESALQPNYHHLPVAYHSRASSIVVSGTPIRRPRGQILENPSAATKVPAFSACQRLDMEFEMAAFVCKDNAMGDSVTVDAAADHLFGVVLMNDWSARDIQAWESVPLGPFNAKNFGTTISPWVVLMDALEPFRCEGIKNDTPLLPYLKEKRKENCYNISLKMDLTTENGISSTIAKTNSQYLLFSFQQMLAHHTVGGCPMRVGDLIGSGTISGPEPGSEGCLLEKTKGGTQAVKLTNGETRTYLSDGDTVTFTGICGTDEGGLVGFGECYGKILPASKL